MDATEGSEAIPSWRKVLATAIVLLVVIVVWKVIDYRMRPPPPPVRATPAEHRP